METIDGLIAVRTHYPRGWTASTPPVRPGVSRRAHPGGRYVKLGI
ncbi:hypothetical protein GJR88_02033 [Dietzia sp. DQ12-45-1b]|nr:hypothetical protein GJR88_02033 [Dietzia sp. DQ12-45-1b]